MDELRIWVIGASEVCYLGIRQVLSMDHEISQISQLSADSVICSLEGTDPCDICILSSCQLRSELMPLCRRIHAVAPSIPILIWSHGKHLDVGDVYKAGASGYVCSCSVTELSRAVEALRQGYQYCDMTNYQSSSSQDSALSVTKLTTRQEQIQMLAGMGLSDKEIARNLGISPHTVRSHLRAIFEITGVHKRTQLPLLMLIC